MSEWVLVDPVARTRRPLPATRKEGGVSGAGKVGFFSNSKQHAAEIEEAMAAAIGRRHKIEPAFYSKPNASVGATPEMLATIALECDVVFTGSGD